VTLPGAVGMMLLSPAFLCRLRTPTAPGRRAMLLLMQRGSSPVPGSAGVFARSLAKQMSRSNTCRSVRKAWWKSH